MSSGKSDLLDQLPLAEIRRVTFYKVDEITTDLICCDVELGTQTWSFHEEQAEWQTLLRHVGKLAGFNSDWHASVSQPAFAACETVAFQRS